MLSDERQHAIIDMLKTKKFVNVPDLARHFYTSEATIRRDLDKLKKTGILKRTHGGAVLEQGIDSAIPYVVRKDERTAEKNIIAGLALKLIHTGDVIIIDSSSTSARMIPLLGQNKPKTVVSNSPKVSIEIAQRYPDIKVYSTGGFLRNSSISYVGESARNMVASISVNTMFFSCVGVSLEKGLTDSSTSEAELKRTMIQQSALKVFLADSSKLNHNAFSHICMFNDIDYLITEKPLDDLWHNRLTDEGVRIIHP